MPDNLKRLFVVDEKIVSYRCINGMYQARFRREGYNIEVASKDFQMMKTKFLEKLRRVEIEKANIKIYPKFGEFLQEWLKIKKQAAMQPVFCKYSDITRFVPFVFHIGKAKRLFSV